MNRKTERQIGALKRLEAQETKFRESFSDTPDLHIVRLKREIAILRDRIPDDILAREGLL